MKHSELCTNLLQAENERTSDNSELFSAEETLISVTRVVHRGQRELSNTVYTRYCSQVGLYSVYAGARARASVWVVLIKSMV